MNIYRSTTPTIVLKVKDNSFDMSTISVCHVTIENDSGRNKKIFEDPVINIEERTISIDLSIEDTEAFETGLIDIQVKIKLTNDKVIASKIVNTTMERILEEGDIA